MHRIDTDGHVDNKFSEGDESNGLPATKVGAEWLNALQEEICSLIEHYLPDGLDKNDKTQLRQVLSVISLSRAPAGHGHSMGSISGLLSALDGKAPQLHTHGMDRIVGLISALSAKGLKNTGSGGETGWWKCGDTGLVRQRGYVAITSENIQVKEGSVTFPVPFANACYGVNVTLVNQDSHGYGATISLRGKATKTGFDWRLKKLETAGTYHMYYTAEGK